MSFCKYSMLPDIFRVSDPSSLHWAGCNERGQAARGYRPQHYRKIEEFHRNARVAAPVTTRVQARPGSASARVLLGEKARDLPIRGLQT